MNIILGPGKSQEVDLFANSGAQVGVTVITSLSVTSPESLPGVVFVSPVVTGQAITFNISKPNVPTLVASASSSSQYIASGASGATNATQATYNITATGQLTVTELKFVVSDSTASGYSSVTNIGVGNVYAQPVSGTADLTGLNLVVPNGGAGLYFAIQVSYSPVGTIGIPSGTTVAIGLSSISYFVGKGGTTALNFAAPIAAPTMTLVGSTPAVALALPSGLASGLAVGTIHVANVTISASSQGPVSIKAIPLTFTGNSAGVHIAPGTALSVRDANGNIIANAVVSNITGNGTSSATAIVTFTSGYPIAAGQSQTFQIWVAVTSLTGSSDSLAVGVGPVSSFLWTDLAGNSLTSLTGNLLLGFPMLTVSIHN